MNGIVLGNRYELLEKIGEGGMSEVFKARCNKLNRFVAVKILKKELCDNPDIVEKFKGEATAIATLSDNNIVNILDVGTQDNINYIVMEYVNGKTLKDVIKQVGKMNYDTAISVAIQIAKALDCAHRNKIIHRDVKPQNILVTEDGIMKVTDFGIAKSSNSSTITNTSTIMGSAHYLSPEQAKGSFIDCRTDLYSLGVVLYEMVTGTLPFEADTAVTIALKHLQEESIPPKNINSKIPDSLNKLIIKSMQKDPNKRYQSAKEMIKDLEKIRNDPNAIIDKIEDDNDHTIIMSAVTEEIVKQKEQSNKVNDFDDEYDDDEYYDDDDMPNKNRKNMKVLVGVIISIVVLIALGFGSFKLFGGTVKEVEVPNIVGKTTEEAKKELVSLNLTLVEAGTEVSDQPEGTVLEINPKAGTKVKENSEVRVIVSGGETKLKMPNLEEYDINTAKTILNSLGLTIASSSEEYSDNVAKGQIISQDPSPDTEVSASDKITVVISKGPQIRFSTVPSVVGLTKDEAAVKLGASKLKVAVKEQTVDNVSDDGKVLLQSEEANRQVVQYSTVTITVGKYVQPEPPTNVTPGNNNSGPGSSGSNTGNNGSNGGTSGPNTDTSGSNTNGPNAGNNGSDTNINKPAGPWDDVVDEDKDTSKENTSTEKEQ